MEISKTKLGGRPTEVAYECGILGPDCIAVHRVWLSDVEVALMCETGTQISHNPSSNVKLGNGIMRPPEMLAVGLGHDAAECNNSRDMFEVMKCSSLPHRASRVDASLQQAPEVLKMATRNAAAALGHETAHIAVGTILMREGVLSTCDEREVLAEANAAFLRVLERMEVPEEYAHLVVR